MPRTPAKQPEPGDLLPLNPPMFHILLVLSRGRRHGYAMIQEVVEDTAGAIRLGPGTLYYSLQKMLERGLIAEADEQADDSTAGERRRTYRITPFGRRVAEAESERLARAVEVARARQVLAERS